MVDVVAGKPRKVMLDEATGTYVPLVATYSVAPPSGGVLANTPVVGPAAHDAVISGAPIRAGARGISANYTAVATGDVADLVSTLVGAQIVRLDSIPELNWQYAAVAGGIVNSIVGVPVRAAQAAGIRNYMKSLSIDHDLLGAATEFIVYDGVVGTVLWRGKLQTPASEGRVMYFDPPLRGSAATAMGVAAVTAVTGGIFASATGYSAP